MHGYITGQNSRTLKICTFRYMEILYQFKNEKYLSVWDSEIDTLGGTALSNVGGR